MIGHCNGIGRLFDSEPSDSTRLDRVVAPLHQPRGRRNNPIAIIWSTSQRCCCPPCGRGTCACQAMARKTVSRKRKAEETKEQQVNDKYLHVIPNNNSLQPYANRSCYMKQHPWIIGNRITSSKCDSLQTGKDCSLMLMLAPDCWLKANGGVVSCWHWSGAGELVCLLMCNHLSVVLNIKFMCFDWVRLNPALDYRIMILQQEPDSISWVDVQCDWDLSTRLHYFSLLRWEILMAQCCFCSSMILDMRLNVIYLF